jgi:hypothetical protein
MIYLFLIMMEVVEMLKVAIWAKITVYNVMKKEIYVKYVKKDISQIEMEVVHILIIVRYLYNSFF